MLAGEAPGRGPWKAPWASELRRGIGASSRPRRAAGSVSPCLARAGPLAPRLARAQSPRGACVRPPVRRRAPRTRARGSRGPALAAAVGPRPRQQGARARLRPAAGAPLPPARCAPGRLASRPLSPPHISAPMHRPHPAAAAGGSIEPFWGLYQQVRARPARRARARCSWPQGPSAGAKCRQRARGSTAWRCAAAHPRGLRRARPSNRANRLALRISGTRRVRSPHPHCPSAPPPFATTAPEG